MKEISKKVENEKICDNNMWDKINECLRNDDYELLKAHFGRDDLSLQIIDMLPKLGKIKVSIEDFQSGTILGK